MSTYTELTETDAKPSPEEAAALRVLHYILWRGFAFQSHTQEKQDEIFAELVAAVKGKPECKAEPKELPSIKSMRGIFNRSNDDK